MASTPFSLHPDLPDLNQTSFVFTGAHLVSDVAGLKNSLRPSKLDGLLTQARDAGWSVNLLDPNPRKLILTFDDGRRITDDFAAVLDAHNATAIFFICTARKLACYPDDPQYEPNYWELSEDNRRYLLERHIVGGHTHAHVNLGALAAAEQASVLGESAARFEEWFGFTPRCFSYPWGCYRGETLRVLRDQNVRYAFLARAGALPTHDYLIPRVFLDNGEWSDGELSFLHRKRREAVSNGKLLIRQMHAGLHLAKR